MIKLKDLFEGTIDAVKHYAVLASLSAALITILGAVGFNYWLYHRVTDLGAGYMGLISKVDQQISVDNGRAIDMLDRLHRVETQCALTEQALKNSNNSRGQVQQLVNSIVRRMNIDENHPR